MKTKKSEVMQLLLKLIMTSLYGEFQREDIDENFECKSEALMMSEYEKRVLDY